MLPPLWRTVTLFNPVVYLVSGFRWSFYGMADVSVGLSLASTVAVHGAVPGVLWLDLPDRLPAEGVNRRGCRVAHRRDRRSVNAPMQAGDVELRLWPAEHDTLDRRAAPGAILPVARCVGAALATSTG